MTSRATARRCRSWTVSSSLWAAKSGSRPFRAAGGGRSTGRPSPLTTTKAGTLLGRGHRRGRSGDTDVCRWRPCRAGSGLLRRAMRLGSAPNASWVTASTSWAFSPPRDSRHSHRQNDASSTLVSLSPSRPRRGDVLPDRFRGETVNCCFWFAPLPGAPRHKYAHARNRVSHVPADRSLVVRRTVVSSLETLAITACCRMSVFAYVVPGRLV